MCGIAGFWTNEAHALSSENLSAMGEAIAHRGPDASDIYVDDNIGLVHRRLAIIDLSDAGIQPMYSADKQCVIVFNGEIYNFPQLRAELIADGYKFSSQTDTEVILALYQRDGVECLESLNGMFAFSLWDIAKQQLFLARDRLGKKPLYYYQKDRDFYFASELKAILTLPGIDNSIRDDAVYDFFAYQYIPDPKTIFTHMHKLPPGHYMVMKKGKVTIEQYWDVSFAKKTDKSFESECDDLSQLLLSKTKARMLSDVDLGAFLSGGVDSGGVVAMMSTLSDKPVKTCTIGFDDPKFNETEFAQMVAERYQTEHHEFKVEQNVADTLEHIVSFFDEPFADPSLVPTFYVSELAKQAVTVAIAGDGGDEVFAGYEKYSIDAIENRLREKFPEGIRKNLFPKLAALCSKSDSMLFKKGQSLLTSLSHDPAMGFYISNSQITDQQWSELANNELQTRLGDYHPAQLTLDAYTQADGEDHLDKILYTDLKTYLPGGILVKVDRMSMANSLEVRAPILDKEVVEFAAALPPEMKFHKSEKKYILKETFKPLLPDDVLYRKKMGFSVPLATWFREHIKDIAENYLVAKPVGITKYFKPEAVQKLWQEHQDNKADHSTVLWSLLMFEMWWVKYLGEVR
ncbi:MAG: asparagine synthase (glutamine-hydrolyzing) [Alteromonadaceae bacterium]|nr:asparagine synthase (glutamine-hydrolyzing) [Alteromonadaceae bacterium]